MSTRLLNTIRMAAWSTFALVALAATDLEAQTSSLFGVSEERGPITLKTHSMIYELPPERKQFKENDIIIVLVSEQSSVSSEGEMDRKKKAHAELVLKNWILLQGLKAIPDPQSAGDPKISGKLDNKLRSEAGLELQESIKLKIACRIVSILPNGNLLLEGYQTIRVNEEQWDCWLIGEAAPDAVLPDNTLLSENLANKRLIKRESGHVRDGYRRGWFLRWLDKWQPY